LNIKSLWGAAVLALVTSSPISAAPVEFIFSAGGAYGYFSGLDNESTGQQMALRFQFNPPSFFQNYGIIDVESASFNHFEFYDGAFQYVQFRQSIGGQFASNGKNGNTLLLLSVTLESSGVLSIRTDERLPSGQVFTSNYYDYPPPVPAVPLPAGGLLLLSGFAGFAGFARLKQWKKRAA
jgi:hypothetical protein